MLGYELRSALRSFRKQRLLVLAIIATVAIVVGVSTCLFLILYGALFRALPFAHPDRLVMVWESDRETGQSHIPLMEGSYPIYQRTALKTMDALGAFIPPIPTLPETSMAATGERITQVDATREMFQAIEATPLLGRSFSDEDTRPGAPEVAILSYSFWTRRFGGSPAIIGKELPLNVLGRTRRFSVIGVMERDVTFPYPLFPDKPDIWTCLEYRRDGFSVNHNFFVVGKLRATATLEAAQTELTQVGHVISMDHPGAYGGQAVRLVPVRAESLRNARGVGLALVAALLLVTSIGGVNIIHLVLADATGRRREIAIRYAMGARKLNIFASTVLRLSVWIAIGGTLGLWIAYLGAESLPWLLPAELYLPRAESLLLDGPVVLFAGLFCIGIAVFLGLALCIPLQSEKLIRDLKNSPGSSFGSRHPLLSRPMGALLVCEIAFAFALMGGAGLMLRSLNKLIADQDAINLSDLVAVHVAFGNDIPSRPAATVAGYESFLRDASGISGVQAVALVDRFPLVQSFSQFLSDGAASPIGKTSQPAEFHVVTPSYLGIAGLAVTEGRWIDSNDGAGTAAAVINDVMARRYFQHERSIGARLRLAGHRPDADWPSGWQIVGVVKEPRRVGRSDDTPPTVYVPFAQSPVRNLTVLVRTEGNARGVVRPIRKALTDAFPKMINVDKVASGRELAGAEAARLRFVSEQLTVLGLVAFLLAGAGSYGVMSFYNSRRTREIAIRIALGGTPNKVITLVVRQAMTVLGVGVGFGGLLSLILVRAVSSLRYRPERVDALMYVIPAVLFGFVGIVTSLVSARRVVTIDPIATLREE